MKPHIVSANNAQKIAGWLATRGGLALWNSINFSNIEASWTTPLTNADGTPTTKPNWQSVNEPVRIITDISEVVVSKDVEVKRFRVGVRMGAQGLIFKVTDGGTRKIRAAVAKAGEGAYHVFDYETQEAVIMKPDRVIPLAQWLLEQNGLTL